MANDSFAPHEFTALICFDSPDQSQAVTEQLAPLGFEIQTATTPEAAIIALHANTCDMVVTSEDFGGADAFTHPILAEIAGFNLDQRRGVFVVLIGTARTSQSEVQAFSLSVDLVLHPQDIPRLKGLVGQGIARKEAFYSTFRAMEKTVQMEA